MNYEIEIKILVKYKQFVYRKEPEPVLNVDKWGKSKELMINQKEILEILTVSGFSKDI